ncbi:MAG: helix-turn-helix domain-containing protein [Candidatus Bathyarchaeia archaeon]
MPLFEVVFRITHDCPFCNISKKFPSIKMFFWCNNEYDVIEIIAERPEEYSFIVKELSKISKIVAESSDQHKIHIVMKTCACYTIENSVTKQIDRCTLLHVSPIVYEGGWEYYRIIAFKHKDLKEFFRNLEGKGFVYDVLRKIPFDGFIASSLTLTADSLFSDLTEKQMSALLDAFNHGYYRLPRKTDVSSIASKKKVPRTTFQEHLKKAENKLISSLIPYIMLYKQAPEEKKKILKTVT